MTLLNDALGTGLAFTLVAATPFYPGPRIEVTQAGKVVVVRSADDTRDESGHGAHGVPHPRHVPGTRLSMTTTSTTGAVVFVVPDLDHVKDATSDRIVEDLKPYFMIDSPMPRYLR